MPLTLSLAHKMAKRLTEIRKNGTLTYLRPDGKTQVTVEYVDGVAKRVDTIIVSTQHDSQVSQQQIREDMKKFVIDEIVPANLMDENTKIYINPTGRFEIGGPTGDSGLTGRKIIVDTYGVNKNTTEYDIHKSCDLINSLYEENEQLIQKKCLSCELVNLQTREIDKLKEENDNCKNDYRELFSNYVALEEENDMLKQKLKTEFIVNKQYEEKERLKNSSELDVDIEKELDEKIQLWISYEIPEELLKKAYDITVDKTGKISFAYASRIIENWISLGYKTLEDVDSADKKHKEKTSMSSFDTVDFFEAALARSEEIYEKARTVHGSYSYYTYCWSNLF